MVKLHHERYGYVGGELYPYSHGRPSTVSDLVSGKPAALLNMFVDSLTCTETDLLMRVIGSHACRIVILPA